MDLKKYNSETLDAILLHISAVNLDLIVKDRTSEDERLFSFLNDLKNESMEVINSRSQEEFKNIFLEDFLKHRSIDDIKKQFSGELPDLYTDLATYTYGNRELFVTENSEYERELTFVVDTIGFNDYLIEV